MLLSRIAGPRVMVEYWVRWRLWFVLSLKVLSKICWLLSGLRGEDREQVCDRIHSLG